MYGLVITALFIDLLFDNKRSYYILLCIVVISFWKKTMEKSLETRFCRVVGLIVFTRINHTL